MKILILFILVIANANSAILPQSKADFCARFDDVKNGNTSIQDISSEATSLMSFKNNGGLFNGGVCWWHSRFQRNIFYLGIFRPDLPKPNSIYEIRAIIHQIRLGTNPIYIPGYENLSEFSSANKDLIQDELESWQLYDGVVLGKWIDGLKGETKVAASELAASMNQLYQYVSVEKKIAYTKLQIKGITSHAWLVVGMKKMPNGYDLEIIDSNSPTATEVYSYKSGDESFFVKGYGNFVPYLEFKREEERISLAGKKFCGIKTFETSSEEAARNYKLDLDEAKK